MGERKPKCLKLSTIIKSVHLWYSEKETNLSILPANTHCVVYTLLRMHHLVWKLQKQKAEVHSFPAYITFMSYYWFYSKEERKSENHFDSSDWFLMVTGVQNLDSVFNFHCSYLFQCKWRAITNTSKNRSQQCLLLRQKLSVSYQSFPSTTSRMFNHCYTAQIS